MIDTTYMSNRVGKASISIGAASTTLLGLYFAISYVYWLPFVPPSVLYYAKIIIFLTSILGVYFSTYRSGNMTLPTGILGITGFALLFFLSIPGFVQSQDATILTYGFNYSAIIILFFGFGYIFTEKRNTELFLKTLFFSSIVILLLFLFLVVIKPDMVSPISSVESTIKSTGFGGGRTGWSNAIALLYPWLILAYFKITPQYSSNARVLIFLSITCLCFFSQAITGGRTGMISVGVQFFLLLFYQKMWRFIAIGLAASIIFSSAIKDEVIQLSRINQGVYGQVDINSISSGRLDGYIFGIRKFSENPILGYGFDNITTQDIYTKTNLAIHNGWLKMLLDGGIGLLLVMLIFVGMSTFYSIQLIRKRVSQQNNVPLLLCVFSGIFISMFEPGLFFGAFQNSVFFWSAIAGIGAIYRKSSNAA